MNVIREPAADASPFGQRLRGWALAIRVAAALLVLGAAGAAVAFAGRTTPSAATTAADTAPQHVMDSAAVMVDADAAKRIGVTWAVAERRQFVREVRTAGLVTVDETKLRAVSPRIDGWIEQLHVNFTGQLVRRGDAMFSIYSPELVAAQQELLLAKRLAADVATASPEAARSAQDLLAAARRRLTYWEIPDGEIARIEEAGVPVRALVLRAPADGFVIEKNIFPGQRINAGEAVYKLADLSTIWVDGEVFEQDHALVRIGDRASVELQAFPGERLSGTVTYLYPTLTAETRTTRVRVELDNPGLRLKPGMYATVLIRLAGAPVLAIPRSALIETGTRTLVFVRRPDGSLAPREVVRGAVGEDHVEILRGLTAGDTVVASATFLIDAESNLKAALEAMARMPGMSMPAPTGSQNHSNHEE